MHTITRAGILTGIIGAAALAAAPASAADTDLLEMTAPGKTAFAEFGQSSYDNAGDIAQHHRRWGRRGWHRYRRHRGVDAGDVIAGVLILGGIAAIADAANDRNRRDRDRDYRRTRDYDRDYDRRDTRRRGDFGAGLDSAVDQCLARIERDVRVESVDSAERTAEGWAVSGALYNGESFTCRIGNNGRIADIEYGGFQSSEFDAADTVRAPADDVQWSDDRYASARSSMGRQAPADPSTQPDQLPAYPGGPLPGEDNTGEVDGDIGG